MDYVLIAACVFLAYSNARSLISTPLAGWGGLHYAQLFVTVALVAVAIWKALAVFKKHRLQATAESQPPPPPEFDAALMQAAADIDLPEDGAE